jgi:hypothetical protein
MDAGLIAILGAGMALAVSLSFLRQSIRARQLRLRLDYPRESEPPGAAGAGVLGLGQWPPLPKPEPPERRRGRSVAEGIEPPKFLLCERRSWKMAPALAVSVGFHAAFAVAGPEAFLWVSRALDEEQRLVVRFENAIRVPLTLQLPEARRVVFARQQPSAPGRKSPSAARAAARPRGLTEPAIPEPARKVESLPAPELPSAAEAMNAPRPQRSYRTVTATTLLQPRRPEARKEVVELPAFAAWTGKTADLPLPQTVPGSPTPGMLAAAPPPRRPVLPFPSGLPVRTAPPGIEEPKLSLPPPGVPVANPPAGGMPLGSGVLIPGEPVSIISISPTPLEPGQAVQIPPVTQAGGGLESGSVGGSGTGGAGSSGERAATGRPGGSNSTGTAAGGTALARGAVSGGAAGGNGVSGGADRAGTSGRAGGTGNTAAGGTGGAPGAAAGAGAGGAGAARGEGGAGNGPAGPPSGGARSGSPYVRQLRLGGQLVTMEQWPDGTLVLVFPPDGSFDVVVVESAFPEALSDLAKRLSGRPVYTAYLDVGAGREWTLHYCAVENRAEAAQNSMVVTLEDPPPLHAPYIQRAELPPAEEWRSSRYQVFHGYITDRGKLERVTAVRTGGRAENLLKSFGRWEFRPATRSKAPVEIEVLLVIPPLPVP